MPSVRCSGKEQTGGWHEAVSAVVTSIFRPQLLYPGKTPTVRESSILESIADLCWMMKVRGIDFPDPSEAQNLTGHGSDLRWPPCCVSPKTFSGSSFGFFASFEEWMKAYGQPFDDFEWEGKDPAVRERAARMFQDAMKSSLLQEKHEKYLEDLGLGSGSELQLVIPGTNCFNPVLENFWKPWAKSVLFSGTFRPDIVYAPGALASCYLQQAVRAHLCWSVPTLPILRCMIDSAPEGRILDVAAGSGYWSALLAGLGADVVAIDDFSWWQERRGKKGDPSNETESSRSTPGMRLPTPFYYDIEEADAVEFIKAGKAEGRALFFSWPFNSMHCLEHYTGDTVFWIGEGSTDTIMPWADEWLEVHRMKIPQWFCLHDEFVVYKRKASLSWY